MRFTLPTAKLVYKFNEELPKVWAHRCLEEHIEGGGGRSPTEHNASKTKKGRDFVGAMLSEVLPGVGLGQTVILYDFLDPGQIFTQVGVAVQYGLMLLDRPEKLCGDLV